MVGILAQIPHIGHVFGCGIHHDSVSDGINCLGNHLPVTVLGESVLEMEGRVDVPLPSRNSDASSVISSSARLSSCDHP